MLRIGVRVNEPAFGYSRFDSGRELGRILHLLAHKAETLGLDSLQGSVHDLEGNDVGEVHFDGTGWPTPQRKPVEAVETKTVNQCDGCRRGLPVRDGLHVDADGMAFMCCTKHLYIE